MKKSKSDDVLGVGCAILLGLVLLAWGVTGAVNAAMRPYDIERCAEACGPGRMAEWSSRECRCVDAAEAGEGAGDG